MHRSLVIPLVIGLLVAGCGGDDDAPSADSGLSIVAAFYPIAEAAERVGGDHVDVANLTPPGVEPHDFELSTDRVDLLLDADLVLYFGEGFQPAVDEVAPRTSGTAIDLLDGEDLVPGVDEGEGIGPDPHVWLDPAHMATIVELVRDELISIDAGSADDYRTNADAYLHELTDLDDDYAAGLADCERTAIVTSHAAFGYLAARYGLTQDAITGLSPESEPDPARLAELADKIRVEGITTIFYESLVSPDVAETLARETGATTAVLNPIEGLSSEQLEAGETYVSVMRDNLGALQKALGCS